MVRTNRKKHSVISHGQHHQPIHMVVMETWTPLHRKMFNILSGKWIRAFLPHCSSIPVSEPVTPKWNVESGLVHSFAHGILFAKKRLKSSIFSSYGNQELMAPKTMTPGFNFQRMKVSDEIIPVQPVQRPLSPAGNDKYDCWTIPSI